MSCGVPCCTGSGDVVLKYSDMQRLMLEMKKEKKKKKKDFLFLNSIFAHLNFIHFLRFLANPCLGLESPLSCFIPTKAAVRLPLFYTCCDLQDRFT